MKTFQSKIEFVNRIRFPQFKGIRVMMMPFRIEDPIGSLPEYLKEYGTIIKEDFPVLGLGVGYLTVDEALVPAKQTHRRPGLHVDGVGAWGGGGGGWAATGMFMAASNYGAVGYNQLFVGEPGADGNCEHLRAQIHKGSEETLEGHCLFYCNSTGVHESVARPHDMDRKFLRVSMPSTAPWFEGYTENPLGIKPTGQILPRRVEQMSYRP